MGKLHHSLSDWDYRVGAKLELSNDEFTSFPTSLRTQSLDSGQQDEYIYLGAVLGNNIPEGRFITYHRFWLPAAVYFTFAFRCQDVKHTTLPDDCYWIKIGHNNVHLWRRQAGVDSFLFEGPLYSFPIPPCWLHFRITWYIYIEEDLHQYLKVIVDISDAGEWVTQLDYNDELNLWAESSINRLGFHLQARPDPNYVWVDDTEVWEKS